MRQGYKISLFFACIAVLVLIALILLKRHALYQSEEVPFIEEIQEEQDDITQVQNTDIRITCDTICMYEDFDKKDGTVYYEEVRMPGKYIGMNRVEMEKALWDDSRVLSLEDKERGFESQHLELFSKERVKIVRIYDTTPEVSGYYIKVNLFLLCLLLQIIYHSLLNADRLTFCKDFNSQMYASASKHIQYSRCLFRHRIDAAISFLFRI